MRSARSVFGLGLLAAALARAESVPEVRPTLIAPCVARAEKYPAHFSSALRDELQALTGPELIAGLSSSDPRPAVQKRITAAIQQELCEEGGHTAQTAATLLRMAVTTDDVALRTCWLRLLGRDRAGRPVLQAFIDSHPGAPLQTDALLAYLLGAKEQSPLVESNDPLVRAFSPYPFVEPTTPTVPETSTVAQDAELLWTRYVALRRTSQPKDPLSADLLEYVRTRQQYHDRIFALVRADVAAGVAPVDFELSTSMDHVDHDIGLFRVLLGWSESATPAVRRAAAEKMIQLLRWGMSAVNGPPLDDSDKVRIRRVLLTVAPDPAQPDRAGIAGILLHLLDGIDEGEARQIADIAEMHLSDYRTNDMDLLLSIADQFEEFRPRVIARLLGPNLDDASQVAQQQQAWPPHPERKWIAQAASKWTQSLRDEDLESEDVQERFLVIAGALQPRQLFWALNLPSSRRQPRVIRPVLPRTVVDKSQTEAETEEAEDRKAFGLPPPTPAPVEPVKPRRRDMILFEQRDDKPLTPRERTVRWQRFVLARATAVRLLRKQHP